MLHALPHGDVSGFSPTMIVSFHKTGCCESKEHLAVNPDAVVIGGRDELPQTAGTFDLALDQTLNSFAGTGGIRRNSGSKVGRYYPKLWNMTVRADAARQAAVKSMIFNPMLPVHEDVDLVERIIRQGGQVVHAPEIVVGHFRDTNFSSFFFATSLWPESAVYWAFIGKLIWL